MLPLRAPLPVFVLAGVLVIAANGCSRHDPDRRLVITGSSTIAPAAGELARTFEATHPGVRVDVQTGGSSRGIADARRGLAAIGMVSRALGADEQDLTAHTFARDGIAMIVHRDNPVAALTRAEVIAIYRGDVARWGAVGGRDAPIVVVNKAEGRATLEAFLAYTGLAAGDIHASIVIGDNEQGVKTIAGNRDAIGYVSIGTAEADIARGVAIRMVAVDGVAPSRAALARGAAPMTRPLNFVTRGEPRGLAREFLSFATSEAARDAIERSGFVPAQ